MAIASIVKHRKDMQDRSNRFKLTRKQTIPKIGWSEDTYLSAKVHLAAVTWIAWIPMFGLPILPLSA